MYYIDLVLLISDQRLKNVYIGALDFLPQSDTQIKLLTYPICKYIEGPIGPGVTEIFTCDQMLSGRYLIVQLNSSEILTLCEVEVFGGITMSTYLYSSI